MERTNRYAAAIAVGLLLSALLIPLAFPFL